MSSIVRWMWNGISSDRSRCRSCSTSDNAVLEQFVKDTNLNRIRSVRSKLLIASLAHSFVQLLTLLGIVLVSSSCGFGSDPVRMESVKSPDNALIADYFQEWGGGATG